MIERLSQTLRANQTNNVDELKYCILGQNVNWLIDHRGRMSVNFISLIGQGLGSDHSFGLFTLYHTTSHPNSFLFCIEGWLIMGKSDAISYNNELNFFFSVSEFFNTAFRKFDLLCTENLVNTPETHFPFALPYSLFVFLGNQSDPGRWEQPCKVFHRDHFPSG